MCRISLLGALLLGLFSTGCSFDTSVPAINPGFDALEPDSGIVIDAGTVTPDAAWMIDAPDAAVPDASLDASIVDATALDAAIPDAAT